MTLRSAAIADDPVAAEAANDILFSGGSALGAAAAAFFSAAAAHSGVLLSPLTLLVAGAGLGARAFDGRCRQPGLGTRRPRGFKDGEPIPPAARVAVPAALTAVLVALGYDEQTKVNRLVRSALRRARDSGAEARAELFERVRAVGAAAVAETMFSRPLLRSAGEAVGGVLTSADLRSIGDVDRAAVQVELGGASWLVPPWSSEVDDAAPRDGSLGTGHAVCAVDVRGMFVALTYRRVMTGVAIEELELEAPPIAVPVLRGVTRVAPGAPIPTPAPIAIRLEEGIPVEIVAAPQAAALTADVVARARLRIQWEAATRRATATKG